jgi:hypothetical protein
MVLRITILKSSKTHKYETCQKLILLKEVKLLHFLTLKLLLCDFYFVVGCPQILYEEKLTAILNDCYM